MNLSGLRKWKILLFVVLHVTADSCSPHVYPRMGEVRTVSSLGCQAHIGGYWDRLEHGLRKGGCGQAPASPHVSHPAVSRSSSEHGPCTSPGDCMTSLSPQHTHSEVGSPRCVLVYGHWVCGSTLLREVVRAPSGLSCATLLCGYKPLPSRRIAHRWRFHYRPLRMEGKTVPSL